MFNTLKRLLGLSSTRENSQPARSNSSGPPLNYGSTYPQPGNYMHWGGPPIYQGLQNSLAAFNPYLGPPILGYPPIMQFPHGGLPNQVQSQSTAVIPSNMSTVTGFQPQGQELKPAEKPKNEVPLQTGLQVAEKEGKVSVFDWPDGDQIRRQVCGQEEPGWKDSKWVWRSKGGVSVEKRTCQGVYECSNTGCGRLYRPRTDVNAQTAQIRKGCSFCHSLLKSYSCDAYFLYYRERDERDGVLYSVWKHFGNHKHKRPPGGKLSSQQQKAVDAQVLRRHDASVHVYHTGDTGPGSQPLGEISETLANPRAARYQVAQSQARLGITPANSVKGGFSILTSLAELSEEFKKPFLVESSVHGPTYLMFQTPFMKSLVQESVDSWVLDDNVRHGFVTDGDHSFFRSGVLLVTCTFSTVMQAWVPTLYTWILRQDIEHHRPKTP
ncbi:hypothetical protein M413DRAFT_415326 [Hebeloma cylindrosporum]|uniref:GCM domain-containing protein n=1 Tax=Hebeloma cylindrosporum TaxID=76867 RepID=A0A0C2YEG9_HEBCY|nr:hypothetical protein M413DRAFT_415326 [Hebeloma cylindrosporum h7]